MWRSQADALVPTPTCSLGEESWVTFLLFLTSGFEWVPLVLDSAPSLLVTSGSCLVGLLLPGEAWGGAPSPLTTPWALSKAGRHPGGLLLLGREESEGVCRTSLVVRRLRIHLPVQRTWAWSLVWEDSMCHGATKPTCHSYCSLWEKPPQREARARGLESGPQSPQLKQACAQQWRPSAAWTTDELKRNGLSRTLLSQPQEAGQCDRVVIFCRPLQPTCPCARLSFSLPDGGSGSACPSRPPQPEPWEPKWLSSAQELPHLKSPVPSTWLPLSLWHFNKLKVSLPWEIKKCAPGEGGNRIGSILKAGLHLGPDCGLWATVSMVCPVSMETTYQLENQAPQKEEPQGSPSPKRIS